MSRARMDWGREARTGLPEAVYCEGKDEAQLRGILDEAVVQERRLLLTRLDPTMAACLRTKVTFDYDSVSKTAILGSLPPARLGPVGIVTGGLCDIPVASEAARTLAFSGAEARIIADIGVAGLWRLLDCLEEIRSFPVLIAVAGMEGALFSVLAGLVASPVIALPVSVGHGVATGGQAALSSALSSCAPGLLSVNIDNGFGAAQAALRILNLAQGGNAIASPSQ